MRRPSAGLQRELPLAQVQLAPAERPGLPEPAAIAWPRMLDIIRGIVARVGLKEIAFKVDTSPSLLADALAERNQRGPRASWLPALLMVATASEAEAILVELAFVAGYAIQLKPLRNRNPEEELEDLERAIRDRFGAAGAELLEERRR